MNQSLCETCSHAKEIVSGKGSRFLLCEKSQTDRRFQKYPPQPVVKCFGYEDGQARGQETESGGGTLLELRPIIRAILDEYALPVHGDHGISHWARVLENGLRLAEATGAIVEVVQLFAVFHDSKRVNEHTDPDHGQRGADFAAELRSSLFQLADHEFALLHRACSGHTHERTHPDITIQTCWDSDRLDLGRVGIMPHPSRLCTDVAKQKEIIQWADGRANFGVVPDLVAAVWGIELDGD